MSLRVMRKLMEKQTNATPSDGKTSIDAEDDGEDEEEPAIRPAKPSFGVLWSELGQDEEDEEEEEGEGAEEEKLSSAPALNDKDASSSGTKKSKKKKRSKKKSKDKSKENLQEKLASGGKNSSEDLLKRLTISDDATQSQLKTTSKPADSATGKGLTSKPKQDFQKLISADSGLLRAEDELKRIFGAKVMREVDKQDMSSTTSDSRRALPVPRGGSRQQASRRQHGRAVSGKKFILVQPLDTWPPVSKSDLSMDQVKRADSPNNELWFSYKESDNYTRVSRLLDGCVESHDPEQMVNLVALHPYHAGGLLALSDMYRHMGEAQVGAELLERALYVLESAWHPYFNPTQGNCRLDYEWEPNQILFLALFRNIQQLSRRGCHRAAFECSKMLLSLNPHDDPHGMLLSIDYFALRAELGDWLEEFVESHGNKSLSVLPNYAFSLALAQYQREEKEESGHEQSSELLKDALLLHPSVLALIVKKAPITVNPEWTKILKAKPFGASHKISPTLEHLCALYSERSSLLWRPTAVQKWLKDTATRIVEGMGKGGEIEQDAANWACVRQETFNEKTNEYRHLLVSDFSDNISTVPPEILMGPGEPPPEPAPNGGGGRRAPPEDLEGRNPLMVFLETILPWNDYGIDPNDPNAAREQPH